MDNRQIIAYSVLLLIALFLAAVLFMRSREWRGERRASRLFHRRRRERRAGQAPENR
jgi:hypothetical protein